MIGFAFHEVIDRQLAELVGRVLSIKHIALQIGQHHLVVLVVAASVSAICKFNIVDINDELVATVEVTDGNVDCLACVCT